MNFKLLQVFLIVLTLASCRQNNDLQKNEASSNDEAELFTIKKIKKGFEIEVKNTWLGNNKEKYLLTKNPTESLKNKYDAVIHIPVKKVVCMSATHVAQIAAIGDEKSIKAVSGARFIYNPKIKNQLENGETKDIAYGSQLKIEALMEINPDVIFMYGVSIQDLTLAEKIRKMNISVVFNNDYLEKTPLSRTEWLLFTAAFFDKTDTAHQIINNEIKLYHSLVQASPQHKTVFLNIPFKDVWYMPGGNSYFAHLLKDAGLNYIFADNKQFKSLSLDFETVLNKAQDADIWINAGNSDNLESLKNKDERLTYFKAFKQQEVYNPVKRMLKDGANDFWETGVVFPHLLLNDLINIANKKPDSLNYFYKKI